MLMHARRAGQQEEKRGRERDRRSAGEYQGSGTAAPLYGMAGHFFCGEADRTRPLGYTQEDRMAEPSAGAGPVLQRKLIINDQELHLEEYAKGASKSKKKKSDPYSRGEIFTAIRGAGFEGGYIQQIWNRLLDLSQAAEVHTYNNINEMIQEVGAYVIKHSAVVDTADKERKRRTAAFYKKNAESVFAWLQDNVEYIVTQTPQWLLEELHRRLSVEGLAATVGAEPRGLKTELEFQTKSSIAGNVIIKVTHDFYSFMIELHPKGGVHYGAYFLAEFAVAGGEKTEWKWIRSKRSSYLPGGEKRGHEFSREADYDILKDEKITPKGKLKYGRKGKNTSPEVKGVAIKKIFSKKGMVEEGIWSGKEKADVEQYRNQLQVRRLEKIGEKPPEERGRMIALEYEQLEKRLLSLEREIRAKASGLPGKEALPGKLDYILQVAKELRALDADSESTEKYEQVVRFAGRLRAVLENPSVEERTALDLQEMPYLQRRMYDLAVRLTDTEGRIKEPPSGSLNVGGFAGELKRIRETAEMRLRDFGDYEGSDGEKDEVGAIREELGQMIERTGHMIRGESLFLRDRLGILCEMLKRLPPDAEENRLIERESAQIMAEADEMRAFFGGVPGVPELPGLIRGAGRMFEERRLERLRLFFPPLKDTGEHAV